jgi:hypothetical protein
MTRWPAVPSLRRAAAVALSANVITRGAAVALTIFTARTLEPAEIGTLGLEAPYWGVVRAMEALILRVRLVPGGWTLFELLEYRISGSDQGS